MNVERLHTLAKAIQEDLSKTEAIATLQSLTGALQNQINQPQQSTYQTQVAADLTKLMDSLRDAPSNKFPPTWRESLEELGGNNLLGSALADRIQEIFNRNQITPAIAREEILEIQKKLTAFEDAIEQIVSAFSRLHINTEKLQPGSAELGVLIPRDFVDNKLEEFATELGNLDRIFEVFAEVATGSRPGFPIHAISSSNLSIFLDVAPPIAACIAVAIERIIALYKQLLEIRKLHSELREQGVPDENLKGIAEHANTFMDLGIENVVKSLLHDFHKGADGARKNELKIELRYSLRKIANRIDQGFNIEVRVEPEIQTDEKIGVEDETRYEEMIIAAAPTLQFFKREGRPILSLPDEEQDDKEKKESKKK
jgi:hypothetical protein